MQNMQYLAERCNVDAFYPFSNLFKAFETFASIRLVEYVEIFSFFKNLLLKNEVLAELDFLRAMQLRFYSARSKFDKSKENI